MQPTPGRQGSRDLGPGSTEYPARWFRQGPHGRCPCKEGLCRAAGAAGSAGWVLVAGLPVVVRGAAGAGERVAASLVPCKSRHREFSGERRPSRFRWLGYQHARAHHTRMSAPSGRRAARGVKPAKSCCKTTPHPAVVLPLFVTVLVVVLAVRVVAVVGVVGPAGGQQTERNYVA